MDRLSTLAREAIDAPLSSPSPMANLLARATARRRHRRVAVAAVSALVVVTAAFVAVDASTDSSSVTTPAHPQQTFLPPAPTVAMPSIPPVETVHQETVPWSRERAPIAVGDGIVWVASDTGVAVVGPDSSTVFASVPTDLPPVVLAATTDGLWVLTGSYDYPRGSNDANLPPYRLLLVNTTTRRPMLDVVLPLLSSFPSSRNVRMAASAGQAWVGLGSQLLRVDARTGALEQVDTNGGTVGHLAADDQGLWIAFSGSTVGATTPPPTLARLESGASALVPVSGFPPGFLWSLAATGDAAWVAACAVDRVPQPCLALFRIDTRTLAISRYDVPAATVVTGAGQLWVQAGSGGVSVTDPEGTIIQIDPNTGAMMRSLRITPSDPGQSAGYTSAPFAIDPTFIWSAMHGLQRTTR